MTSLSEKAYELRNKYNKKLGYYPRGLAHGEETMEEYEKYLEKELRINTIIQKFKNEAKKLENLKNKNEECPTLDNGRTKYTELYEKYKKQIDEIK